jgi:hypothetical protein
MRRPPGEAERYEMKNMSKPVEVEISKQLTDDEWKIIELFKSRASKLKSTKLYQEYKSSDVAAQITIHVDKGISFKTPSLPDESVISEHIIAFRHFCLEKEPCFFPKVLKIISKYASEPIAKVTLKKLKQKWKNPLFQDALHIDLDGSKITAKLLIDLWFNGEYFHSDTVKSEDLKKLIQGLPNDFAKVLFVNSVMESTKIILKVADGMIDLSK